MTEDRSTVDELAALVSDASAGAVVTFAGVVRDHDQGRAVTGITYSAHPDAETVLREAAAEFCDRVGVHGIAVVHRIGELGIGDLALGLAVSASHRGQAFACASDLVDRIKEKLPVWKHQHFADGTSEWSACP